MSNDISALREHLFETMKSLRAPDNPMEIERAMAVSAVAKTIIETAKVEVDYLRVNNGGESTFMQAVGNKGLPPGITGVRQHRLK